MADFRKKERHFPSWLTLSWLWILLLVWGLNFGSGWLGQVHAKWREVLSFAGLPQDEQRAAIFGSEMALLQTKVAQISRDGKYSLIVVPEKPYRYAIGNNAPLLRAVSNGQFEIASLENVAIDERGVMFWHPEQVLYQETLPPYIERVSLEAERVVQ
ncbi:hypothetical protein LRY65_04925 [Candidatus Woesebacteria bacterium]|nr:hypothetical protein [Candidatus Woesebacteria bacterium]MCD8506868.1 hypothetical protein [Candidatus Woesebacteria bacterium]MCD8527513.1 hypothetical protein [Candidatus Woesebacteria bacterium]MCD8546253.1 hypothetical protein [Candidatus Woesebacteria bacterium]